MFVNWKKSNILEAKIKKKIRMKQLSCHGSTMSSLLNVCLNCVHVFFNEDKYENVKCELHIGGVEENIPGSRH